jgi:hypothetical protein
MTEHQFLQECWTACIRTRNFQSERAEEVDVLKRILARVVRVAVQTCGDLNAAIARSLTETESVRSRDSNNTSVNDAPAKSEEKGRSIVCVGGSLAL